jgi:hypothetical protein
MKQAALRKTVFRVDVPFSGTHLSVATKGSLLSMPKLRTKKKPGNARRVPHQGPGRKRRGRRPHAAPDRAIFQRPERYRVRIVAPDGAGAVEEEAPLDPVAIAYETSRVRLQIPKDGKRGVYALLLQAKGRESFCAPVPDAVGASAPNPRPPGTAAATSQKAR